MDGGGGAGGGGVEATTQKGQLRSRVKVEVAVLGLIVLIVLNNYGFCGRKATLNSNLNQAKKKKKKKKTVKKRRDTFFFPTEKPFSFISVNILVQADVAVVVVVVEVLLYVHRNRRFIRHGSPGRPPRLSHSS